MSAVPPAGDGVPGAPVAPLDDGDRLPVVVVGAGPVGLTAAAHLLDRGLDPLVLEAAEVVGASVREWGHIRMFTPWQYIVDPVVDALLTRTGWTHPAADDLPTGSELVERYLVPLAAALGERVRTGSRVVAVSRDGLDRSRHAGRDVRPFLVRVTDRDGTTSELRAQAVVDASGTWRTPNPLGAAGLAALGEERTRSAGAVTAALPDVLGEDRARFAGRRVLVVGSGHSAANTLISLARLAAEEPGTTVLWAIRQRQATGLLGGDDDRLAARGKLATELRTCVAAGAVRLVRSFGITRLVQEADGTVTVVGRTPEGERRLTGVDVVVPATGFRPDLSIVSELQLDLDPALQTSRRLAPLIDPESHICSTVPPHGHRELAHPETNFFIVGMKSYGRAPTFLITTANEQVRSVVAAIAGDGAAADEVRLVLPEVGAACECCRESTDGHAHDEHDTRDGHGHDAHGHAGLPDELVGASVPASRAG